VSDPPVTIILLLSNEHVGVGFMRLVISSHIMPAQIRCVSLYNSACSSLLPKHQLDDRPRIQRFQRQQDTAERASTVLTVVSTRHQRRGHAVLASFDLRRLQH
jgi:hypothetical protein